MFKVIIALSLFLAIQGGLIGGFKNRCDLVEDPETLAMVNLAVTELAQSQNLQVTFGDIVGVATQVVNGLNYRIIFTARDSATNNEVFCATKIYQSFSGARSVSSVGCA